MKKFFKITALIATVTLACAFIGCSNGSDATTSTTDDTSTAAYVGTYEYSYTLEETVESEDGDEETETIEVPVTKTLVTKDDGSFTMTTVASIPNDEESETVEGTYTVSGNTVIISYTDEADTVTITGIASDDWATVVVEFLTGEGESPESYTFTKKAE